MGRSLQYAAACAAILAVGCVTAPYTNRSQLMLLSESQDAQLGAQAYAKILSASQLVQDPAVVGAVRGVGERIANVAARPDYRWQFTVIDQPKTINAFALPGGKVAVYSGLLPVARDTGGLAAVLAHEVAHAIARHGAERASQTLGVQVLGTALAVGLGGTSPATSQAIMQLYGLGAQVGVLLPWSRTQESEADHIGLILMAKAGYDPSAALELWRRMEACATQSNEQAPPEFLSTHPAYGTRQRDISSWLPEASGFFRADNSAAADLLPLPPNVRGCGTSGTGALPGARSR